MLSELLSIIWKNFKVVFRTPSLILLLVIGPLALILLVGSAFSSNATDGAKIGAVYEGDVPELDLDVRIEPYSGRDICIEHLVRGKLEACVHLKGSEDDLSVQIYYDDTRPTISQIMVGKIQGFLGLASDEITLASTTQLINELNNFISFARETENDLNEFLHEVNNLQTALNSAESSLREANNELYQQEAELLSTKRDLDDIDDEQLEDDERETYNNLIDSLDTAREGLDDAIDVVDNDNVTSELISIRNDIITARSDVESYHYQFNQAITALRSARRTVDNSLVRIDSIQVMVQEQINDLQRSKSDAQEAEDRLLNIQQDLNNRVPEEGFGEAFAQKIAVPIDIGVTSTLPYEPTNIQKLFPLIAATVAMFISLLLSNILTLSEIHSPAYLRTVISPMSRFWFILGIFITNLVLVAVQMGVLFNTGWMNFGIDIMSNVWYLIAFVVLEAMIFTLIGMLIAYLVNSEQTSILITTFTILFLFLISDAVFPVEIMPAFARFISSINPLMIHKELFRYSLFYAPNFKDLGWQIILAGGYVVAGFILVTLADFGFKKRNLK